MEDENLCKKYFKELIRNVKSYWNIVKIKFMKKLRKYLKANLFFFKKRKIHKLF
jgi:hypothetical protein